MTKWAALLVFFCVGARAGTLELLVLGSGGPRPFGRAGSSYVVLMDGTPRILVDAGPGASLRIGQLDMDLEKVDTILLTHLHIDHTGDLPAIVLARALTAEAPSVRFAVFGPDGAGLFPSTANFVNLLFGAKGAWAYQKTFGADEDIATMNLPIRLDSKEQTLVNKDGVRSGPSPRTMEIVRPWRIGSITKARALFFPEIWTYRRSLTSSAWQPTAACWSSTVSFSIRPSLRVSCTPCTPRRARLVKPRRPPAQC